MKKSLVPITQYQGGKRRLADQILDIISPEPDDHFYDLCCGAGAVSIELVKRGHSPEQITMVDAGPYGLVWEKIGNGTFDLATLELYCNAVPSDPTMIRSYMEMLADLPASKDTPYVYLLLQSYTFGGRAIWIEDDSWIWRTAGFRTGKPSLSPITLLRRTENLMRYMEGIKGVHGQIQDLNTFKSPGIIYVDPPYIGTKGYGHGVDLEGLVSRTYLPIYVSEARPLTDDAIQLEIPGTNIRNLNGARTAMPHEEWLSRFNGG